MDVFLIICSAIGALGGLVTILSYFNLPWPTVMTGLGTITKKKKLLLSLALFAISYASIGVALYRQFHEPACIGPLAKFNRDQGHLKSVYQKTFINEHVPLDGFHYDNCTFINIAFIYNETEGYALTNNHFQDAIAISTDSDAVDLTARLVEMLLPLNGGRGAPIVGPDFRPLPNWEPIRPAPKEEKPNPQ